MYPNALVKPLHNPYGANQSVTLTTEAAPACKRPPETIWPSEILEGLN